MRPIHNINHLVNDVINTGTKILGIGMFSYGISEYWWNIRQIIHKIASIKKKVVIMLEDVYPKVANLNKFINRKSKFKLGRTYNYDDSYPLDNYVDLKYDSVEFLKFIEDMIELNKEYDVEIYGINELIDEYSKYRKIDVIGDNLDEIYEIYPELKKDKSKFANFIIKNRKLMRHPSKFMADFASYIHDTKKSFSVIIAHNEIVQISKLNGFKTMGYMLRERYGYKYKCIGTASRRGMIKYIGDAVPLFKYYKQPNAVVFIDEGSLQRYLENKFTIKGTNIFKVTGDSDLYYFTSGKFKPMRDINKLSYRNVKYMDYLIYFYTIAPTHNLVL